MAHVNINSIRNKFDALVSEIQGKINKPMISETKLDESSSSRQLAIKDFTASYWLDRKSWGGGILVNVREDILWKFAALDFSDREEFSVEENLSKKMWVVFFLYNPRNSFLTTHMRSIGEVIESLSAEYENLIMTFYFNTSELYTSVENFCSIYSFKNLIKPPTFLKPT